MTSYSEEMKTSTSAGGFSQPSAGYNYIVSAHKPTAVLSCATGKLLSPNELNLLIARKSTIEIHVVTPEGLKLLKEVQIYGRISCMKLFNPRPKLIDVAIHPPGKEFIFVLTDRYNVMILECTGDNDNIEVLTRAWGNMTDNNGKDCESGMQAVIDPDSRCIVLRLYEGLVKVIPLEDFSTELSAFNVRLDELQVCDIQFLHGCQSPTLIKLHHDNTGRHVRTHTLSLAEKEFSKAPWKLDNVEAQAVMVIAVPEPMCGAIVVGQETISYITSDSHATVSADILATSTVTCHTPIDHDGRRYLLGDLSGRLFLLLLEKSSTNQDPIIKLEKLGEICTAECMTYLDNGVVYVGSKMGDSMLIRLNTEMDSTTKSYITTMQTFPNLGPIVDMTVVDLEKQGQGQLVTCSGAFKDGSLRIIRNGVGIQELACIELPKIRGMWSISLGLGDPDSQNTLCVTFATTTRFLKVGGDIVDEIRLPGFLTKKMTFHAANVAFGQIIQVTRCGLRLVDEASGKLVQHWAPPEDRPVSLATSNPKQIVVTSGQFMYYLIVKQGAVEFMSSCELEHEVACVDITPLGEDEEAQVVSVGMWTDITTRILTLPNLVEVYKEALGGDIIPRSMLLTTFEGAHYLLVAIGDGQLIYYIYNKEEKNLTERKRVVVGMLPTQLRRFTSGAVTNVFACSDRPTVIYSSNHKLVFSKVNLKEVTHMCSLNAGPYANSLALANGDGITIGKIDEIQKLHIRTVPLGETPRLIAYQEETETFGVVTYRNDVFLECTSNNLSEVTGTPGAAPASGVPGCSLQYATGYDGSPPASLTALTTSYASSTTSVIKTSTNTPIAERGQEIETYNLLVFSQNTFEVVHCHTFCPHEYVISMITTKLRDDPTPYFIAGTAVVLPEDSEPKIGRIVIFSLIDNKLVQVAEKEVKGAVYSLREFQGKILATVSNTVRLFEWTLEKELQLECTYFNSVMAICMKTKGDFILVGDIMRSMYLLQYKTLEGNFEEIARDFDPNWITAVEVLDDEFFLGAEHWNNLFVCHKDSGASSDEERQQMTQVSCFHLGDFVNVFCPGSLVMRGEETGLTGVANTGVLFGTVNGGVGLCISISGELYTFLTELTTNLCKVIKSVGKIDHKFYRSFSSERRKQPSRGFIDGDLIELFLDLPREKMAEVCLGLTMKSTPLEVSDVVKLVEELSRLH